MINIQPMLSANDSASVRLLTWFSNERLSSKCSQLCSAISLPSIGDDSLESEFSHGGKYCWFGLRNDLDPITKFIQRKGSQPRGYIGVK